MTTGTFFFGNIARRKPSLRDRESLFFGSRRSRVARELAF
jgi:hypothetical protein